MLRLGYQFGLSASGVYLSMIRAVINPAVDIDAIRGAQPGRGSRVGVSQRPSLNGHPQNACLAEQTGAARRRIYPILMAVSQMTPATARTIEPTWSQTQRGYVEHVCRCSSRNSSTDSLSRHAVT